MVEHDALLVHPMSTTILKMGVQIGQTEEYITNLIFETCGTEEGLKILFIEIRKSWRIHRKNLHQFTSFATNTLVNSSKKTDKPVAKLVVKPVEKLIIKPAEKPAEKPAKKPAKKPARKLYTIDKVGNIDTVNKQAASSAKTANISVNLSDSDHTIYKSIFDLLMSAHTKRARLLHNALCKLKNANKVETLEYILKRATSQISDTRYQPCIWYMAGTCTGCTYLHGTTEDQDRAELTIMKLRWLSTWVQMILNQRNRVNYRAELFGQAIGAYAVDEQANSHCKRARSPSSHERILSPRRVRVKLATSKRKEELDAELDNLYQ
tara:strand:- start:2303 stop:3268 length:966 start_codon:yes stop_codon:yes gene_type:complete